jgi:hypothetical protein
MRKEKENKEYFRIHYWLRQTFGKASICENINCKHLSKRFEYALKKGFEHEKNRENYIQFCKKCHQEYDYTKEWGTHLKGIPSGFKGKHHTKENKDFFRQIHLGTSWSKEQREKLEGRKDTEETKKNKSLSNKGKHGYLKQYSDWTGRSHSEKSKKQMKISQQKRWEKYKKEKNEVECTKNI